MVVFVDDHDVLLGEQLLILMTLRRTQPTPLVIVASERVQQRVEAFADPSLPLPIMLSPSMPVGLIGRAMVAAYAPQGVSDDLERVRGHAVSRLMDAGRITDSCFDELLPWSLYAAADRFWTPVPVIERAAHWIRDLGIRSVVDVGCGVGKFCILSAMFATSCSFIGVEYRARLATIAREIAAALEVEDRVSIIDGRFGEIELPSAECYYLFNPFEENLFPAADRLDDDVELSPDQFWRDLRAFRRLVASLPVGTYVMTYNGVGGRLPESLEQCRIEKDLPSFLRLFQKVRSASA